jgi:hypothetical protein
MMTITGSEHEREQLETLWCATTLRVDGSEVSKCICLWLKLHFLTTNILCIFSTLIGSRHF